ncbi:hypothetical protein FNV43_RR09227 [Rhamnella rubrinervis]|uniref:Thaumatin-like protein n=1 Tax=Rhamnella rubrinervis TaxID=2594499 RepID=A0A8K0HAV3_9ROSA|nr:hypothetical protein FNV43_RR09227 [Rhamnella rubrinervis]
MATKTQYYSSIIQYQSRPSFKTKSILTFLLITLAFPFGKAATFDVRNNCGFTVWAAAIPGGGLQLDPGQTWSFNVNASTARGRIWARTGCNFNEAGRGTCETGDCDGVIQCTAYGQPPNTLADYALNQYNNLDFFGISLVDGFNVPMEFSATSNDCTRGIGCAADINGQCPNVLRAPGGCNNPCTVFKTDQYCCNSGSCGPTAYSRFFKDRCPDAFSYPDDDQTSTFSCPGGTDYKVVFCPSKAIAQMHIQNNCSFTVWAAAKPGGGRQLNKGETWTLNVKYQGRIWGRTNCDFDENGRGKCDGGDCDGLLQCQTGPRAPCTLAEYSIGQNNVDNLDISLVDGFNVPIGISPTNTSSKSKNCRPIKCAADVNEPCPMELRDPGGCNNPCTVFRNDQFCCRSNICEPTNYSKFFKHLCPDAYSYPLDDATTVISCLTGTSGYNIMFCP